ncbi:MAG: hypothetical protein KVP17_002392 [Porospora cf. gigantea B]|uniref:uncharacterized protein n=2 Tax=Porospora cf. gigantea B TaxID=2853592 RepID=UPI003571FB43|nr:MAG: hypothetical protein KVP17_002392 [Porospora cf. gigantea B]
MWNPVRNLRFGWNARPYMWRYILLTKTITMLSMAIVVMCLATILIDPSSFTDHSCNYQDISVLSSLTTAVTASTAVMAFNSLLCYLLMNKFVNITQPEIMHTGRVGRYIGCMIKYIPWAIVLALIMAVSLSGGLGIMLIFQRTYDLGFLNNRCRESYNEAGAVAVENCRAYFSTCDPNSDKMKQCSSPDFQAKLEFWYYQVQYSRPQEMCFEYDAAIIPDGACSVSQEQCTFSTSHTSQLFWVYSALLSSLVTLLSLIGTVYVFIIYDTPAETFLYQPGYESQHLIFVVMRRLGFWAN